MFEKKLIAAALLGGALCVPPAAQAGTFTSLLSLGSGIGAAVPLSGFVVDGGKLFGMSRQGGLADEGTVYEFNPKTRRELPVYNFTEYSLGVGFAPGPVGLSLSHGVAYGATSSGVGANGAVFRIDPQSGALTILHLFSGGPGGLYFPNGAMLANGLLYGTASSGGVIAGSVFNGGVFAVDPNTGTSNVLHTFSGGEDGGVPAWGLIHCGGALFGTTTLGGKHGDGVVFRIDLRTGTQTVVHSFAGAADGSVPLGLLDAGTLIYGVANAGGADGDGTIFSIDPTSGAETTLHSFAGAADGSFPVGGLTLVGKYLYGTTSGGGVDGQGVLFRIDTASGAETVLHSFTGKTDGGAPTGTLTYTHGVIYGTTSGGGTVGAGGATPGGGTIFQYVP